MTYVESTWIEGSWAPEVWSVFGQPIRTNNDTEGWHRRLNYLSGAPPPFYHLVKSLHDEASISTTAAGPVGLREEAEEASAEGDQVDAGHDLRDLGRLHGRADLDVPPSEEALSSVCADHPDTTPVTLEHVNLAVQASGGTDDLLQLRRDLLEIIKLTEESLLSLKKSELLKTLDDHDHSEGQRSPQSGCSGSVQNDNFDAEYAEFQAMLQEHATPTCEQHQETSAENSTEETDISVTNTTDSVSSFDQDLSELCDEIMWSKCRARYRQEWGETSFNNALIVGIETQTESNLPKVRVMFTHPTLAAMLPCKYHLEDTCKFTAELCRFSHGYLVDMEDFQEYEEPDYSNVQVGMVCQARYSEDDLWYKATIVDIGDDSVTVKYENYGDDGVELPFQDIWPLCEDKTAASDSGSDDDVTRQPVSREDSDDDELPVFLWKPQSHGLGDLGQWEAHTTGIGSRLLTKMGYVPGQGLGKDGEGRVDPVPIQLLPQGKSLDKIMELKERAGERDLFDVLEKDKKKKNKDKPLSCSKKPQRQTVFDFMNRKLGGKKGNVNELVHNHAQRPVGQGQGQGHSKIHRNISEHDLTKKSERHINVQLLKTSAEMRSVEKELAQLQKSLCRNENRDKNMATQVKQKIQSMENYLQRLKTSEQTMQQHQKQRTAHKKLTIF